MKDLTKYYIDLSKCTEREIISIAFLTRRTVNLHNKAFSYMSKGETLKDFVCLAATDSGEWTLWNEHAIFEKTELTYPEFIKLFEGGEGEKPEKIYTLDEMIGFAKFYILHHAIPYELDVVSGKITDEQKIEKLSNDVDYSWNELADEYIKTLNSNQ